MYNYDTVYNIQTSCNIICICVTIFAAACMNHCHLVFNVFYHKNIYIYKSIIRSYIHIYLNIRCEFVLNSSPAEQEGPLITA